MILQREVCAAHVLRGLEAHCDASLRPWALQHQGSSHDHGVRLGWALYPYLVQLDRSAVYLNSRGLCNFAFIFFI
jgi:hypothetical protein